MKQGIIIKLTFACLFILLIYSGILTVLNVLNLFNSSFVQNSDTTPLKIINSNSEGFIVYNPGTSTYNSVYLIMDDLLVSLDLDETLLPESGVFVKFSDSVYNSSEDIMILRPNTGNIDVIFRQFSNSSFLYYNNECNDNNYCTMDNSAFGLCDYSNLSNGEWFGCNNEIGCEDNNIDGIICSCNNGDCIDSCGDNVCQSWEDSSSCLNDCNNCQESISECSGTWFYGGIIIEDGEFCACCGDDSVNDNFNNGTHFCTNGVVSLDLDLDRVGCETNGHVWIESDSYNFSNLNTISSTFTRAFSIFSIDLDKDGDKDIIGSNYGSSVGWWENNGSGLGWTPHVIDSGFSNAVDITSSDLDFDGDYDVIGVSESQDILVWWENDGTNDVWTEHLIKNFFDAAFCVDSGDINGDGFIDIVAGSYNFHDIIYFENNGSAGFTEHVVDNLFSGVKNVIIVDVNGDDNLDIIGAGEMNDQIAWWSYDGINWTKHLITSDFNGARSVGYADLDSDGDLDILGAAYFNHSIRWWENNGLGLSWTEHSIVEDFIGASRVITSDVDGDGDLDVIAAGYNNNKVVVYENINNGNSWTELLVSDEFLGAYDILTSDLDADGDFDIVGAGTTLNTIGWWENSAINGVNGPCCGDDEENDNFSNHALTCVNGVIE